MSRRYHLIRTRFRINAHDRATVFHLRIGRRTTRVHRYRQGHVKRAILIDRTKGKLVKIIGDFPRVCHAFVRFRKAILVTIHQACEFLLLRHIDAAINDC